MSNLHSISLEDAPNTFYLQQFYKLHIKEHATNIYQLNLDTSTVLKYIFLIIVSVN